MAEEKGNNGRKQNQKMKPFLTYHILIGMGNNPEAHATVAPAVAVYNAMK